MPFHAIAILSGGRQKTIPNRTEDQMLSEVVSPFVASGAITAKWGATIQSYQVLELRIYETAQRWDKRTGPLTELLMNKRNKADRFIQKAEKYLGSHKAKVFIVMAIQGEQSGTQEEQRIYKEYDDRFEVIEKVVGKFEGIAIRIDKEHALEDLVGRIKREIQDCGFVIADLTDERPSCYFEVGYAEALKRPVIYIASKQSVMKPGVATKIHFDIHMSINFFVNHRELKERLSKAIEKNKGKLFLKAPEKGITVQG
jgi:hypothetical protein